MVRQNGCPDYRLSLKRILRHDDGAPQDLVLESFNGLLEVGHWLIVQRPSKPLTELLAHAFFAQRPRSSACQ
jgi:hypothetical protein